MMNFAIDHQVQSNFSQQKKDTVSVSEITIDKAQELEALWRDLYLNCAEPNPCYAPDFVKNIYSLARLKTKAKILVIKQTTHQGPEKLIGLLPLGFNFRVFHSHAPIYMAQHSCYNGSSLPLIRMGFEEVALSALLNWLSTKLSANGLFMFYELPMSGPVGHSLINLLKEREIPFTFNQKLERPLVDVSSAKNFDDYSLLLKGRTKQTLKRKKRQLSSLGRVTFSAHTGSEISKTLKEFCDLEMKGWKGRAGTALLQDPRGKNLAFKTLSSSRFGLTRIEALRLDGQAIAMNIYIGLEKSSLLFKPTYDEAYAKFSPGSLLHFEAVQQLYKEKWTQRIDSAVLPSDQLGSIWRQRQVVGNIIFGFSQNTPSASVSLADFVMSLKYKAQSIL